MISAKQTREKTDIKRVVNFKTEIEKLIKHSIDKGRDEARISGTVPGEIIEELKENGYIVEEQKKRIDKNSLVTKGKRNHGKRK